MYMNSGRYSVLLGISLEEKAMVCILLAGVCSMTTADLMLPVIPWKKNQDVNWMCHPIRHITRYGTQPFCTCFGS